MIYLEAPTYFESIKILDTHKSLFLAGGITDCPDWQETMIGLLRETDLILFNPRRKNFPIKDPLAAFDQITWEHNHLNLASYLSCGRSPFS